jgi:hypothetical protein
MRPHERCEIRGELAAAWFMSPSGKSLALQRKNRQVANAEGVSFALSAWSITPTASSISVGRA